MSVLRRPIDLLCHYLDHGDAEFRTAAGTYVLSYWGRLSFRFHDALRERFRIEVELPVLMNILYDGMSRKENAPALSLAEIVLERGNDVAAAWLMEIVREKDRSEPTAEDRPFIERCRTRAGAYARVFELPDMEPGSVASEAQLVQVAWLWKQVTGNSPSLGGISQISVTLPGEPPPAMLIRSRPTPPEPLLVAAPFVRNIARGLHGSYAVCAHYILSRQAQKLPALLQEYLSEVESGEVSFTEDTGLQTKDISNEVREAILSGRRERDAERAADRQSIPAFPIHTLGAAWR